MRLAAHAFRVAAIRSDEGSQRGRQLPPCPHSHVLYAVRLPEGGLAASAHGTDVVFFLNREEEKGPAARVRRSYSVFLIPARKKRLICAGSPSRTNAAYCPSAPVLSCAWALRTPAHARAEEEATGGICDGVWSG